MSENVKQGDKYSWVHELQYDDGSPVPLQNAESVSFIAILDGDTEPTINKNCTILNEDNGLVGVNLTDGDTDVAGMYEICFKCVYTGGDTLTVPSSGRLWMHIEKSYLED